MNFVVKTFLSWLPLAVAITGLSMLVQITVQQNYRHSLNDPQIQMAEDAAYNLSQGGQPAAQVPPGLIDIRESLAPWIGVYTDTYEALESNAMLDGKTPVIPQGVLEAAKNGLPLLVGHHLTVGTPPNENRISWQPRSDVRQAIVVVATEREGKTFYVVAGRNMREVENREGMLSTIVFLAWIAILVATFALQAFVRYIGS